MSESRSIEIEELCAENDDPWCLYAEGHHEAAAFIEAVEKWEEELCGGYNQYDESEVKHTHYVRQHAGGSDEAVYCYVESGPSYPGAFPVTVVYL